MKLYKKCILFSIEDTAEFALRCHNLKAQFIRKDMLTLAHGPYTSMTALAPPGGLIRRFSVDLRLPGCSRSFCQRLPLPCCFSNFMAPSEVCCLSSLVGTK
jgi:hypothetical protein